MVIDKNRRLEYVLIILFLYILPVILILQDVIPFRFRFLILISTYLALIAMAKRSDFEIKKMIYYSGESKSIRTILPITLTLSALMIFNFILNGQRIDNSNINFCFYMFFILVSAPIQEFIYRSYLFHLLLLLNFAQWQKIIFSSFLYSYAHAIYEDFPVLVMTFLVGIFWGIHYEVFKSLHAVITSHALLGFVAIATGLI